MALLLWGWVSLWIVWGGDRVSMSTEDAGCTPTLDPTCGQLCYAEPYGNISLPANCSGRYCDNMRCTYKVCPQQSDDSRVSILFLDFNLEHSYQCLYDALVIREERFCGSTKPTNRKLTLDSFGCIDLRFQSNSYSSYLGFNLTYSTDSHIPCPSLYIGDTGNVSLPTECDGRYCPNMNCYIGICPDSHSGYITLTFALFHVDDNETCSRDVLEINGTAYCNMDSVPLVFTLHQRGCLNLTFRSDNSHQGLGFRLSYKAGVAASCPVVYIGPKGVIVPPSQCLQPTASSSSSCGALECAVKVCPGPKASHVSLAARQWDLSCPDDFLEAGGRRYCQAFPQGEVLALDGRGCLDLLFHWNSSVSRVQLLYSLYNPECGVGDLVSDSGLLSVPTTCQGRYCDNLDCSYRLCASSPSPSLAFSLLMMDIVDLSCTGDYLTIGTSQHKYCSLVSVPLVSVDRWGCVSAGFHSDGHAGSHGFLLSFSTYSQACGVLGFLSDHGTITLPAKCDGKYCPNLNCTYTVCPQSRSTHVQITQRMFHTVSTNCATDFLQINQTRICEFDPRPKLYSVDARGCLSMTFRSDNSWGGFGFRLDYTAVLSSPETTVDVLEKRIIVVGSVLSVMIVVLVVGFGVTFHRRRRRQCPSIQDGGGIGCAAASGAPGASNSNPYFGLPGAAALPNQTFSGSSDDDELYENFST